MSFYMTYARSRPADIVPYAEANNVGLMTNAAHRWSDATNRFLDLWQYDTPHIVDSGGYNVQSNYGGYPWSVTEYHRWLDAQSNRFQWAAVMDLACERRFDHLYLNMPVYKRLLQTIEHTIEHFENDPNYRLLPVLQGRTIDQYVHSYDLLRDHGIPTDYVGLGTVCRISSSKEIVRTEAKIRDRCKHINKIHGFGVKIEAFKMGATFDTADSQAWVYMAARGEEYRDTWNKLSRTKESDSRKRTVQSFKHYHRYASRLKTMANGGGQLQLPPEGWQESKPAKT